MITGTIRRDAFIQSGGGVIEQLRRTTLDRRRLRPLGSERRRCLRPLGYLHFRRCLTGQVGDVVGFVAAGRSQVGTEAGDVGRQVPALTFVQLIGEGRHVRPFHAQAYGAVDRVETQAIHTRGIAKIGRRRHQANTRRAIAGPGVAMAD
ncbi:hypothetical protein D3C85_1396010 [compost metagenome]